MNQQSPSPLIQLGEVTRWAGDLVLGIRLAVGGGRSSWIRLALTGLGIGLGVAVLLAAAALPTAITAQGNRSDAIYPRSASQNDSQHEQTGGDVLYFAETYQEYRGYSVRGGWLTPGGPNSPVPPGVDRLPGDGEMVVSPALAALLASPDGELLRPWFSERIVGTIGQAGLEGPYDLRFYAGDAKVGKTKENTIYGFGRDRSTSTNPFLYAVGLVFVIILLFPVLVFVGISTRLSGAQRDHRLAALRLIGASARRVRRIAAGEALLGSFAGLACGFAIFYYLRPYTEQLRVGQSALFRGDLTPSPVLTALIVVFVPVLAVASAIVAMRRTVIEPLGVVRQGKPVRRMLWWRVLPIIVGVGLLVSQVGAVNPQGNARPNEYVLAAGICGLMLGIPLLLPWLVERSVGRLHAGSLSWQLAVRRLQLHAGAAARVAGGVAVVLAGAIALQTILISAEQSVLGDDAEKADTNHLVVSNEDPAAPTDLLRGTTGVKEVYNLGILYARDEEDRFVNIVVADCAALRTVLKLRSCADGSAYVTENSSAGAGNRVTFTESVGGEERRAGQWTLPRTEYVDKAGRREYDLYVTPSVLNGVRTPALRSELHAVLDPAVPDAVEHARAAVGPLKWRTHTYFAGQTGLGEAGEVFVGMRRALLAGAIVVLLLVGASLLVMALEQIRERRRPLAVLVASGVPRRVLAWSVLWQNAFPLLLGMIVAVSTGAGLGALLLKVLSQPVALDWGGVVLLTGITAAAVLAVTLLTLPSLRRATGALGLRSE